LGQLANLSDGGGRKVKGMVAVVVVWMWV